GTCEPGAAHPEVLGVHVQLVTVQLGQLGEGVLDVVQVLHSIPEGGEHFLAMGTDHGVAKDGGGAGEVPKGRKEPLGPGVDNQQPVGNRIPNHSTLPCCEAGDHNLGLLGPSSQHTSRCMWFSLSSSSRRACQAWVLLVLSHHLLSSLLTLG
uniref:Uncharacterized protein n=1 Tax=Phasianus colchicus TaxID=9054 RepID=A0A669QFB3_PHACC